MTTTVNVSDLPVSDRLATLNTLRAVEGKKPLAQWKASRAELEQRIADLTPAPRVDIPADKPVDLAAAIAAATDVPVTIVPPGASTVAAQKKAAKVAAKAERAAKKPAAKKVKPSKLQRTADAANAARTKAAPAKVKKTTTTKSPTAFAALLQELKLDAKQARATLRRKGFSAPYEVTPALRAALTTDSRKK